MWGPDARSGGKSSVQALAFLRHVGIGLASGLLSYSSRLSTPAEDQSARKLFMDVPRFQEPYRAAGGDIDAKTVLRSPLLVWNIPVPDGASLGAARETASFADPLPTDLTVPLIWSGTIFG